MGRPTAPALEFPFCILIFRDQQRRPGLVYLENFRKTLHLEDGEDMTYYSAAFDALTRAALTPAQSRDLMLAQLKALGD
jgi:Domain of unknown function (DUF5753)